MSTYVVSDVHGRAAAFDRALERVSLADDDTLWVLGDMIDRGPAAADVLRMVRDLPCAHAIMGNHERLMLDVLTSPDDQLASYNWLSNGGAATHTSLLNIPVGQRVDLLEWAGALPAYGHAIVAGRAFLFAHSGIRAGQVSVPDVWDDAACERFLSAQTLDDLLWIREDFWGCPTGLVRPDGAGAVVVCGHTPTPLAAPLCDRCQDDPCDPDGRALMLRVGACQATGGIADRVDIDCACASGAPTGQVCLLRLDDGAVTYEAVADGE